MKKTISLLLAVLMTVSVFSYTLCTVSAAENSAAVTVGKNPTGGTTGDCTWEYRDGTLTISGNGAMPDEYDVYGMPWVSYSEEITKVVIGDGVTYVSAEAFLSHDVLQTVSIGKSVTGIGMEAFKRCENLTTVQINGKPEKISTRTFQHCKKLENINIPDTVTTIGYQAFSSCSSLKNITLPDSVEVIDNFAFEDCTNLQKVTLGNSVQVIDLQAFFGCTSLNSINLPDSLYKIEGGAFIDCISLKSVTIPYTVTSIGDCAFGYTKDYYEKIDGFTIYGYDNSAAEDYAKEEDIKFVSLGASPTEPVSTEPETTEPVGTQPETTEPIETQPETTEPIETQPETTEPVGTQPSTDNPKKDINIWNVSGIEDMVYTGKPLTQRNLDLTIGEIHLVFNARYQNNVNAGTATIIITGPEDEYTGQIIKHFKITKAKNPINVKAKKTVTAKAKKKTTIKNAITVKKAQGKVTYKTNNKKVKIKKGKLVIAKGLKKGNKIKVNITVTAKGNKNYKQKKIVKKIKIKVK